MTDRTFVKHTVSISKVETIPSKQQEWVKLSDIGDKNDPNKPQYGYATKDVITVVETEILKQEIQDENLDIKSVIKAINGI